MSSSAPTLPIELYRQIVLDPVLNLRDLLSLSLTSRAFCSEAYSALYSRVELRTSQETKLALRTFIESDRVVKVVRELVLRPDEAFRVEFGKETPWMIRAIHRMSNLKALTLGYLWTADPFGEAHNAAASPSTHDRDMPQPQLGPPGPGRTAWTRGLQIPHIERLTIEANTYRPIRDLFGALPDPLPHLVCIRPLHIRDIKGIRKVTCERLYGQIPIEDGKNSDGALLGALEYLEVANLDSYPTQTTWAPHLTTVSMIVTGGRGRYFIPIQSFDYMKSIKKIGPVDCHEKDVFEDLLNEMQKLAQLEGIVLVLRRIDYRDFGSREIERLKRAAPCLRWVALVPENPNRPGVYLGYKKWLMEVNDNPTPGELVRWYMEERSIDDWGLTLSVLLDAGGPQGISQLQILVNVMEIVSQDCGGNPEERVKRPCDVFSLVGGVGTGGLIAIFLVVLRLTAKQALEEFTSFVLETFGEVDPNPGKQTEKLKRSIEAILRKYSINKDDKLITPDRPEQPCKLVVPIMYKNHVGVPCVLKNYIARHEPPTNLTIAEAMLASCATPPMFTPASIKKDFATFEYISGGLGLSNPTREIIAEAHHAFGDEATIACLLSIGCGHPGVNTVPSDPTTTTWTGFLERLAMDSEKTACEVATHLAQLNLYYRLSVRYGLEDYHSRALGNLEAITTHTTTYLQDLETFEIAGRCVDAIMTGDGFTTLEQLRHAGGSKVLPPPRPPLTPNYVERKIAMEFMEKTLFDEHGGINAGSKRIMVTGIGGCGKTQLVRKFVELYGDRFISTFLVDGSSRETLRRDLVRHVRSLNAAHSQDSFDDSMTFLSQFVPNGQRLLIIDNVDDPALDLSPLLPRWTNGAVIVTSRSVSRGQLSPSAHLQLKVMSLDESVELLERGSGREWPPSEPAREAAMEVAKELGCHPIALVQAISYMSSTGYTAEMYISRLRAYRKQLLNNPATNQLDMRYVTVFAAFDASYDILPSNAQNTLHLLSFFHRQKFPLDLITLAADDDFSKDGWRYLPRGAEFEDGKGYLKETFCPSGQWNPCEMDSVITSLRNQSLIAVVPAPDVTLLEMHSLVHEWSRFRVPGGMVERVQAAAIRLLCCGAKDDNFRMMQYLSSHAQALSFAWVHLHANGAASFRFILLESGMYANAAKLRERVYESLKIQCGMDHPHTIRASANLAVTYKQLGRYTDAETLEVDVLRRLKQLLGPDHPDTIRAFANLAGTYRQLGRYTDAETLEVDVLRRFKQLLGPDHPDTIRTSGNLAVTYILLGRYTDAQVLLKDAVILFKSVLGLQHPETLEMVELLSFLDKSCDMPENGIS